MSKASGLGDNLYVAGYDLSGDIGALQSIRGGPAALMITGIDKSAPERTGGLRDASIDYQAWWNPTGAHPVLSALPTTDQILTYCRGTALGDPAACLVGKQVGYDGNRDAAGNFPLTTSAPSNGYGLEWGVQLTAGKRTDTAASNGTGVDTTASASFGAQAYLQVFAFTGTDVTVKIQDSADNVTFADVTDLAFTQITSSTPTAERIITSSATATIRRYVRAVTVTTGGVTSVTFAVALMKNATARSF